MSRGTGDIFSVSSQSSFISENHSLICQRAQGVIRRKQLTSGHATSANRDAQGTSRSQCTVNPEGEFALIAVSYSEHCHTALRVGFEGNVL